MEGKGGVWKKVIYLVILNMRRVKERLRDNQAGLLSSRCLNPVEER